MWLIAALTVKPSVLLCIRGGIKAPSAQGKTELRNSHGKAGLASPRQRLSASYYWSATCWRWNQRTARSVTERWWRWLSPWWMMEVKPDVLAFFRVCFFVCLLFFFCFVCIVFLTMFVNLSFAGFPLCCFMLTPMAQCIKVGFPRRQTISRGEEWESRCSDIRGAVQVIQRETGWHHLQLDWIQFVHMMWL